MCIVEKINVQVKQALIYVDVEVLHTVAYSKCGKLMRK